MMISSYYKGGNMKINNNLYMDDSYSKLEKELNNKQKYPVIIKDLYVFQYFRIHFDKSHINDILDKNNIDTVYFGYINDFDTISINSVFVFSAGRIHNSSVSIKECRQEQGIVVFLNNKKDIATLKLICNEVIIPNE